jgi:hypothetical protein
VARQNSLIALILITCLSGRPAPAQGTRPPSADEILVLHQAGLPDAELGSVLDRNGVPVVAPGDLSRLAEAGVPETVLARLRAAAPKPAAREVSLAEIVKMNESGVPETAIIETIQSVDTAFEITAEQWLDLVRRGMSPTVLKALRGKAGGARPTESRPAPVTLDDVTRWNATGMPPAEVVQKIKASDSAFDVSVDQIITLSRQGVAKDVLKEIWARRATHVDLPQDGETPIAAAARPDAPPRSIAMNLHVESGGNFSMLTPAAFRTHRETRGANALVSFLLGENDKTTGLAEAELSIFRYRATTPERLTDANLGPIANNFLASLQASYAKRHLTVSFGERQPVKAAGQPGLEARVVTTAGDGTTHQGRILITYGEDQIFVISTAIRTDRMTEHGPTLEKCLRSFALLTRKARPTGGTSDDEKLTALAHAWRDAVLNRDWALFDSLFTTSGQTDARREQFVTLCDRFCAPGRRLVLGPATVSSDGGRVEYRIIPSDPPESFTVHFVRDGQTFALSEE